MNKVILLGRLTHDPEVRCAQDGLTITRYSLAINRRVKRQGEAEADFIHCVAFGKAGEFAGNFFRRGQLVAVVGRLQIRDWQDKDGNRRRSAEVVVDEQHFAEPKRSREAQGEAPGWGRAEPAAAGADGLWPVGQDDEDLPF